MCLEGYKDILKTSQYCYMIAVQYASSWENANEFCKEMQGTLVMPKTKEINDIIKKEIINNFVGIWFWIGMNRDKGTVENIDTHYNYSQKCTFLI